MRQLYALIEENSFSRYQDKFPDAVKVGKHRLGVFLDTERGELDGLEGLTILTYKEALEFSNSHKEESPL